MMKVLMIFSFLWLSPSLSQANDGKFKYVMCNNKSIVRTIRVEWDKDQSSCETTYTKAGIDKVIGNGKFYDSCVKFLSNVQGNLEKAGWSCKDISNSSIHQEDQTASTGLNSGNG